MLGGRAESVELRRLTTETVRIRHAVETLSTPAETDDRAGRWRTERAERPDSSTPPVVSRHPRQLRRAIPRQAAAHRTVAHQSGVERSAARQADPHRSRTRGTPGGHVGIARVPAFVQLTRRILRAERPAPVFVDETGRRHRVFVWTGTLFAALGVLAVVLFWLAQTGPPVGPR